MTCKECKPLGVGNVCIFGLPAEIRPSAIHPILTSQPRHTTSNPPLSPNHISIPIHLPI